MAHAGQELTDPDTGARLRFVRTARSSRGEAVTVELEVGEGWSAGPLHVHPGQSERMRVGAGVFQARVAEEERLLSAGDEVEVPCDTAHTIRLVGTAGVLEAEFAPALRTDELFETMFSPASSRRPPSFVPGAIRAWVESRGYAEEIRYLWPRRAASVVLAAAAVLFLPRIVRRVRADARVP